jgi:hypothetical protein
VNRSIEKKSVSINLINTNKKPRLRAATSIMAQLIPISSSKTLKTFESKGLMEHRPLFLNRFQRNKDESTTDKTIIDRICIRSTNTNF